MQVKIKKFHKDAVIPKYAKDGDAGMDMTAVSVERKGDLVIYDLGVGMEIPKGYVGLIFPRSSICKTDLELTNCVGVIDSGYRGNIKAFFRDTGYKPIKTDNDNTIASLGKAYEVGDRVCQIMIVPYPQVEFTEVEDLEESERGTGGFGSSGK